MGGTIANVGAILAGSGLGWKLRGRLPEQFHQLLIQVLGIFTLLLGGQMFLAEMAEGTLPVLLILGALLAGAMLGEALQLEDQLQKLGKFLELRLGALGWLDPRLSEAFITSSLLFGIGPMAILGSIQDGLNQDPAILYLKSAMDGVVAIAFGATLGPGTALSTLPVLLYQGSLTLLAVQAQRVMTTEVMAAMNGVGGFLLVGIGLNLLGLLQMRIANLLPALAIAMFLAGVSGQG